jgi:hypothetical protein
MAVPAMTPFVKLLPFISSGCLGSGGEDRLLVDLQHGKQGREILRVIRARRVCDAQVRADKEGAEFSDLS